MASMPPAAGDDSRGDSQNPRRKLTSTVYGSPVFSKPPTPTIHRTAPPFYPVWKYPSWQKYSAYPPPLGPQRKFRGCNTVLDFTSKPSSKPIFPVPHYHTIHYIPRVFTWDWTARQHLTGLKRLQRFLSRFPIAEIPAHPEAIGVYLYIAKREDVDLGLLGWPQRFWNTQYLERRGFRELVEETSELKLRERIRAEQYRVDEEFPDITPDELYEDSDGIPEPESDSPSLPGSDDVPSLSSDDGHSSGSWDDGYDAEMAELDEMDEREWLEFVDVNQQREGLGWWAAKMDTYMSLMMDDECFGSEESVNEIPKASEMPDIFSDVYYSTQEQAAESSISGNLASLSLDDSGDGANAAFILSDVPPEYVVWRAFVKGRPQVSAGDGRGPQNSGFTPGPPLAKPRPKVRKSRYCCGNDPFASDCGDESTNSMVRSQVALLGHCFSSFGHASEVNKIRPIR